MQPVAKARARTVVRGGKVRSYTPAKTMQAEQVIRAAFMEKYGRQDLPVFKQHEPVQLVIICYLQRPGSLPKRRTMPTGKPDADNYLKLMDSLNGYAWYDDAQIVKATVSKQYGSPPRIVITAEKENHEDHT